MIGLYKTELVRWEGPWRGLDDLELGTLDYVDWFNHTRLCQISATAPQPRSKLTTTAPIQTPDERPLAGQLTMHETRGGSLRRPVQEREPVT